ncbi:hypothetical protein D3C81_1823610 [compost metagenome]
MTYTRSNDLNRLMMQVMMTKKVTGDSIGSVMFRKRCRILAPSMFAASYNSLEIPCKPARNNSI